MTIEKFCSIWGRKLSNERVLEMKSDLLKVISYDKEHNDCSIMIGRDLTEGEYSAFLEAWNNSFKLK